MSSLKSRWKRKGTGEIIHPETEIDQLKNGDNALAGLISLLLKSATTTQARSAIEAAAASHKHSSGDIQNFASDVITAIGEETLEALGVRYSITTNGYICFGQLFGGLILQWMCDSISKDGENTARTVYHNLPISFPNNCFMSLQHVNTTNNYAINQNIATDLRWLNYPCYSVDKTQYMITWLGTGTCGHELIALGY